jgi:cholesterol oxidase
MIYLLRYAGADGQTYLLDGYKLVKDDPGFDLWSDNTTLFTRIRKGGAATDPIVAIGVLRIGVAAFVRLLTTVKVRNGAGLGASTRAVSRFGRFFLGDLWETYVSPRLAAR